MLMLYIFFNTDDAVNEPDPINSNKLSLFLHLYSSIALLIAFSEYSNSSISNEFLKISFPNFICSFFSLIS